MSEPKSKVPYACGHCEGETTAVNPKWLTWKREQAGLSISDMSNKIKSIKNQKGKSSATYQYVYKLEGGYMRCTPAVLAAYSALKKAESLLKTRRAKTASVSTKKVSKKTAPKKAAKRPVSTKTLSKAISAQAEVAVGS